MSRYLTAAVEQALFSLLNLGMVLALGVLLTPEGLGACVLWFAVAYVLGSVQNAVSVAHLQVLPAGPGHGAERRETERVMLAATAVFLPLTAAGSALAIVVLSGQGGGGFGLWTAALYVPAYLLQQYVRLNCFSRGEGRTAAIQTGLVLVATIGLMTVGVLVFRPFTALHVLGLMAVAYGGVGVAGLLRAGKGLGPGVHKALPAYLAYVRRSGWLFLGVSSTEVLARFYVFAVGAAYGPAVLATLSITQTFLRPAPLLATAWSLAARNDLVALRDKADARGFVVLLVVAAVGGLFVTGVWTLIVEAAWPFVTDSLLDGRYADARGLIALWGVSAACSFLQTIASTGLQSLRAFKALAIANTAASIVAAVGVVAGLHLLGPAGAVAGTAAGQGLEAAAMGLVLVVLLRRLRAG